MPIYEYICDKCKDEFEAIQGFSDKPITKCKKCGGKVHKRVSQSSFHLKGSGWYTTDYSRSSSPAARHSKSGEAGDTKNDTKAETKSEPKTETKPGTKTETKGESKTESTAKDSSKSDSRS